jgi:hypothetical protein
VGIDVGRIDTGPLEGGESMLRLFWVAAIVAAFAMTPEKASAFAGNDNHYGVARAAVQNSKPRTVPNEIGSLSLHPFASLRITSL